MTVKDVEYYAHGRELVKIARDAQQSDLINRFIGAQPGTSIADARLRDYSVPVWALIGHLRAVDDDAQRVADDYALPVEAVQAAVAFYDRHRSIIDDRIRANDIDAA